MNMFECPFSLHSRKSPHECALISPEKKWSYLECEMLIEGCVSALKKEGVKPNDPVALILDKTFLPPLLFFALLRIGAIVCPINTNYPLTHLSKQLDELQTLFVIHPDEERLPKIKQIKIPFDRLKVQGKKGGQVFLKKEALSTYLLTSGTTSKPKIACHSLGNHYYSALGSNAYLPIKKKDRYQLSLPLYHIAGIAILFRTFIAGGSVALSEEVENITHTSMVPTQLYRLLEKDFIPKYRHVLLGGAAITPELYYEAINRGMTIHPTYGMTEMSSQIATQFKAGALSLGHPLPYREIKISNLGEIWVKGKTLFQGYLQEDGSLFLPLNEKGYFATSDLGTYFPTSGLQVTGRKDRLFISGGENIQPEEIERLLEGIDGVTKAHVVPIPDKEFGFRPRAYIETKRSIKKEEVINYLKSLLPKFKIPTLFLTHFTQNKK